MKGGHMGTESRGRYLLFALRIRKLTDALIALVEEGRATPDLDEPLKEVLASLEDAGQPTSVQSLRQRGSFGHYENVVTIDEVVKAQDKAALIQKLSTVIKSNTEEERKSSALEAIGFFDALESRALYHYNHPSPTQRFVASK
jgi:hypothetical protein